VHCTATSPQTDVDAAWVDRIHRIRGWRMNGYHAIITRQGEWQDADGGFPCRPIGESGAHVGSCGRGWNGRSFGVALSGGVAYRSFSDENRSWSTPAEDNFTLSQGATLILGICRFLELHPRFEDVTVLGHRDLIALTGAPPKDCPSFDVGELLRRTEAYRTSELGRTT
jgi:hypothetical protein